TRAAAAPAAAVPATLSPRARAGLVKEVEARERAFAKTMADRDLEAFRSFLSDDVIFFSGPEPLRGPEAVVAWWARYFEGDEAPFSWEPDQVEVLESGSLAFSTGPVYGVSGEIIGRFNSVWRLEAPGTWRIVF